MPEGEVFWWVERERMEERGRRGIVRLEQRTVVKKSQPIDKGAVGYLVERLQGDRALSYG